MHHGHLSVSVWLLLDGRPFVCIGVKVTDHTGERQHSVLSELVSTKSGKKFTEFQGHLVRKSGRWRTRAELRGHRPVALRGP